MSEHGLSGRTENLTMRRLIDDASAVLLNEFPELHAPLGLVLTDGSTAQAEAVSDYDSLAQLFGNSFSFALRDVVKRAGVEAEEWSSPAASGLRQKVQRVNNTPINGMFTFARVLEVVPQVMRRERKLEPYTAEQLTQIATNSTELALLLAGHNSHFSRLILGELALAPHAFYSKDGYLMQREVLNPAEFALDGQEPDTRLKIRKSKDELAAAAVEMHAKLSNLAEGGTMPDFSREGRCYAFEQLAAIQGRMALVAGMTLYVADAAHSAPQLPGGSVVYDEGPALSQAAWNNAFGSAANSEERM